MGSECTFSAVTQMEGFDVKSRLRSFGHAGRGLLALVRDQHNARIHAVALLAVIGAAVFLGVSRLEWCALVLAMAAVVCAEAFNTALEHLADAAVPEQHPLIGKAKDVAAGAVLVSAIGAALVGVLVLGPPALARIAS